MHVHFIIKLGILFTIIIQLLSICVHSYSHHRSLLVDVMVSKLALWEYTIDLIVIIVPFVVGGSMLISVILVAFIVTCMCWCYKRE